MQGGVYWCRVTRDRKEECAERPALENGKHQHFQFQNRIAVLTFLPSKDLSYLDGRRHGGVAAARWWRSAA